MHYSPPYHAAVALQKLVMDASKTAKPKELAMLGRTFVCLEMLKLRMRMKPAPKPIDVQANTPRKHNLLTSFTEAEELPTASGLQLPPETGTNAD